MIELYDTTLRDGTQGEGVNLTAQDKLRITSMLDEFGVQLVEGGWPGSNPKDAEYFRDVRKLGLKNATISAFGSTCRPSLSPQDDDNIKALLESEAPVVAIFGKAWTRHVTEVLRTDLENNLRIIEESVAYLRSAGRRVVFDAEHFFDGYFADREYAVKVLRAAANGGADTLVLCDTNGGTMPWMIEKVVGEVSAEIDVALGIHSHNDSGCAVANSITAVRAGVEQVQGTINGIGERCGNADLCTIVANLELKLGEQVVEEGKLRKLTELSRAVSEVCNSAHPRSLPYVGRSAFAHKGGVHVAALQRDSGSYEHISPAEVGNDTRILVSELSGRGNINYKANEFGIDTEDSQKSVEVLTRVKELENRGFSFEAAEASLELMMRRKQSDYKPFFEMLDFMVVVEHREKRGHLAEANVKIKTGGQIHHTVADGVGPVGALDIALRKALITVYPEIERFHLVDYKVRILEETTGTSALTRVLINSSDGTTTWSTVGASRNIIEASWQAIHDSFEYGLMKTYGKNGLSNKLAESA